MKFLFSRALEALLRKPLVEGLVLKSVYRALPEPPDEAPRGGAGIEIRLTAAAIRASLEAPRGGAGIEIWKQIR